MSVWLSAILILEVGYGVACGLLGGRPGAPLWLRWPMPIWNRIAHDWRPLEPEATRPDYRKIARLERELGIGDAGEECQS